VLRGVARTSTVRGKKRPIFTNGKFSATVPARPFVRSTLTQERYMTFTRMIFLALAVLLPVSWTVAHAEGDEKPAEGKKTKKKSKKTEEKTEKTE
jgi:hypothetical protein